MNQALTTYFDGEKSAGLLLTAIAVVFLAAAAVLYAQRWGVRPLAVTLAVMALVELAIGVGLYFKTDTQVSSLVAGLAADPAGAQAAELARMTRVQDNFVVIEWIEVTLLVACAAVALWRRSDTTISGVALGVLLHAGVLLAFDITAERRGAVYHAALSGTSA